MPVASKPSWSTAGLKRASITNSWNPPSNLVTPLNEVWQHQISYCVRWDSTQSVSQAQRSDVDFPYDTVDFNVVGWAVKDKTLLGGDTSGIDIYTTTDVGGIPDTCEAGKDRHYDQSLWLTDGFQGSAGGDWGQRVGQAYFFENLNAENMHIYLHEIGHTFALDGMSFFRHWNPVWSNSVRFDLYDWTPAGQNSFIMLAGSATEITEFEAWMARDWWRHLKSRYNL
ncbi:uncharacterized protein ATNIH1004_004194 [Aspergillus tanneri]|uniref:Uncharacterized protein n=1 Tax=Aspergillus tanneri TaxID=1220188 RepID=A0A5M9MUK9_9EURO|nr:uncharacterized protein ATNIH1004_004194 [Aspergillus tanneri]KAA8648309.1 hypothetical protein ATNIH1004_004194 [Aspergillus tanneri]